MRKLFSPKHKDDSGQRGQEPALTMPDGSPLPPLPDLVVLDKKFSEMLDALAIPAAARPKMLQQAPQQKWLMLQMQDLRKKAKPQDAKAANYVTRLAALGGVVFDSLPEEENAEACEFMDSLRVELSGCSLDWLRQFFDAGGLKELTHVMLWNTHNPRVMYSCVKAIKSAAKVTDGLAEVVRTPNLVAALTGAFGVGPKFMPAMKLRSAVLQVRCSGAHHANRDRNAYITDCSRLCFSPFAAADGDRDAIHGGTREGAAGVGGLPGRQR
jgi:hypothetical protein